MGPQPIPLIRMPSTLIKQLAERIPSLHACVARMYGYDAYVPAQLQADTIVMFVWLWKAVSGERSPFKTWVGIW